MIRNRKAALAAAALLLILASVIPAAAQSPQVISGLEVLLTEQRELIQGKRVGLVANHSAVDRQMNHAIDLIAGLPGTKLTAIFGPEHGIRGAAQGGEKIGNAVDERSGATIYSLYGQTQRPTPEMLANVDVLVFDIQDAGVRFYTYISTLGECMEAAADKGIPFIVLDRPNLLADTRIEGRVLEMKFKSFVGAYPIPIRYGLTIGELAGSIRDGMKKKLELTVVKMKNYRRGLWYDQTGLPWILPSPNLPHLDTAIVYPGMCLIEGTNVSEGRGTTRPFETIGAPWIDADKLADELRKLKLPGVLFRPTSFTPTFSKYDGEVCHGIQVHVTDRNAVESVRVALQILHALKRLYPDRFQWRANSMDRLAGSDDLRLAIDRGESPERILDSWAPGAKAFDAARSKYFLYPR